MPNSYIVRCGYGSQLCRNRKHLRRDQTNKPLITHPTPWEFDNDVSTEPAKVDVSVLTQLMVAHVDNL